MPSSSKIFRKVALDRLSSPEQIDQLLQLTPARDWLFLSAILALLIAAVIWGFAGTVTSQTIGHGVIVPAADGHLEALLYVASGDAKRVEPGMRVEVSPASVRREEFGFIRARVASIAEYPATEAAMLHEFDNPPLARALSAGSPVTEVRVEMEPDPTRPGRFRWSSGRGAPVRMSGGTMFEGEIVTDEKAPIDLVVPYLREKFGIR
jgi:hypothetical protein